MGMVFTQHVTNAGSGLFKGLIGGQAAFVHGVQNAAVDRLQTVPNIRQSPAHNDGHCIFNIGFFHFVHQVGFSDYLVRETDILWFIAAVMCHDSTSIL